MPLPDNQIRVLRYLGKHGTATARNVSRDLDLNRTATRNALWGLAGNGLALVDRRTFPALWSLTDMGSAVLAAANFGREQ